MRHLVILLTAYMGGVVEARGVHCRGGVVGAAGVVNPTTSSGQL